MKEYATIFRGATRPPMFLGVPLTAFIMAVLPAAVGAMFLSLFIGDWAYLLFLIPVIAYFPMREMTKRDDQYLRAFGLNLREKVWLSQNRVGNVFFVPPKPLRFKD